MDKLKGIYGKILKMIDKKNRKKLIENALIVLVIGVMVIIAGGSLFSGKDDKENEKNNGQNQTVETVSKAEPYGETDELEKKLENILSQISGAGEVSVMVTYVTGREIIPAYDTRNTENETKERDKDGGSRDITQQENENNIAYSEQQNGIKEPIVVKEYKPVVRGVLVVCEGADKPMVKDSIVKAVQALTDIPIHKIQVFEKES